MLGKDWGLACRAIESNYEWARVTTIYSHDQLVSLATEALNGTAFDIVQSLKILGVLGDIDDLRDSARASMLALGKTPARAHTPFRRSFASAQNSPTKLLILCGSPTSKVTQIAKLASELGVSARIALLPNFILEKPYQLAEGTWYPRGGPLLERFSWPVEKYTSEKALIGALGSERDEMLVITMGNGRFSQSFISSFSHGIVNAHNGLLPELRGLDSPAWSTLTGQDFGVTLHYINSRLDLGEIISSHVLKQGSKHEFDLVTIQESIKLVQSIILENLHPVTIPLTGFVLLPPIGYHTCSLLSEIQ